MSLVSSNVSQSVATLQTGNPSFLIVSSLAMPNGLHRGVFFFPLPDGDILSFKVKPLERVGIGVGSGHQE
jgi:hypothetical protein